MKNNKIFIFLDDMYHNFKNDNKEISEIDYRKIKSTLLDHKINIDGSISKVLNERLFIQISNIIIENKFNLGGNIFVCLDNDKNNEEIFKQWINLASRKKYLIYFITNDNIESIKNFKISYHDFLNFKKVDFTEDVSFYNKIFFFGDLQGCFTPVNDFFLENGIHDNELYVFLGDYIDRGIENDKTVDFIFKNINKSNFIFLKGNHEEHLNKYSKNLENLTPKTFLNKTLPQILPVLNKNNAGKIYDKMYDFKLLKFGNIKIFVSHAGFPTLPKNQFLINKKMCITGFGSKGTDIDKIFNEKEKDNIYQLHGHRNQFNIKTDLYDNSFNLEGKIEFGENLRIVSFEKINDKVIKNFINIKNNVFNKDIK